MASNQLLILLLNSLTSVFVSYFYVNYFSKKKNDNIESKLDNLMTKYNYLVHNVHNMESQVNDLEMFIEKLDHIIQRKSKGENENMYNIEEYIMLAD
jgi:peptidoglycan hydrolase CwlO-like protein